MPLNSAGTGNRAANLVAAPPTGIPMPVWVEVWISIYRWNMFQLIIFGFFSPLKPIRVIKAGQKRKTKLKGKPISTNYSTPQKPDLQWNFQLAKKRKSRKRPPIHSAKRNKHGNPIRRTPHRHTPGVVFCKCRYHANIGIEQIWELPVYPRCNTMEIIYFNH